MAHHSRRLVSRAGRGGVPWLAGVLSILVVAATGRTAGAEESTGFVEAGPARPAKELARVSAGLLVSRIAQAVLAQRREPIFFAPTNAAPAHADEVGLCVERATEVTELADWSELVAWFPLTAQGAWQPGEGTVASKIVIEPPSASETAEGLFPRLRSVLDASDLSDFWFDAPTVSGEVITFKLHVRGGTPAGAIARARAALSSEPLRIGVEKRVIDAVMAKIRSRSNALRFEQMGGVEIGTLQGVAPGLRIRLALHPVEQASTRRVWAPPAPLIQWPARVEQRVREAVASQIGADGMGRGDARHAGFVLLSQLPDFGLGSFVIDQVISVPGAAPWFHASSMRRPRAHPGSSRPVESAALGKVLVEMERAGEVHRVEGQPSCFHANLAL